MLEIDLIKFIQFGSFRCDSNEGFNYIIAYIIEYKLFYYFNDIYFFLLTKITKKTHIQVYLFKLHFYDIFFFIKKDNKANQSSG